MQGENWIALKRSRLSSLAQARMERNFPWATRQTPSSGVRDTAKAAETSGVQGEPTLAPGNRWVRELRINQRSGGAEDTRPRLSTQLRAELGAVLVAG